MEKETPMFSPEQDGLYCKLLKILITEENLHLHWELMERCIFPKSNLTWMEHIFGPVHELFDNPELNDFLLEWHGDDREAIIKLFLGHSEDWNYWWMNYYKDVVQNPTHYESTYEFPYLPPKIPKCLGHITDCENRAHHFCPDCVHHFNDDPEYAYSAGSDRARDCCLQMPATPETSSSF